MGRENKPQLGHMNTLSYREVHRKYHIMRLHYAVLGLKK